MSAVPATFADDLPLSLTPFESVLFQTVLEHRGTSNQPSLAEVTAALTVLRQFTEQREDNPSEPDCWEPSVNDETQGRATGQGLHDVRCDEAKPGAVGEGA